VTLQRYWPVCAARRFRVEECRGCSEWSARRVERLADVSDLCRGRIDGNGVPSTPAPNSKWLPGDQTMGASYDRSIGASSRRFDIGREVIRRTERSRLDRLDTRDGSFRRPNHSR
jgi:hypothetical protein